MTKKTNIPKNKVIKEPSKSDYLAERIKLLLKSKDVTFNELAEKMEITSTGLYLSFKRGKVTISSLERIAKILNVHPFYFFEADIIERLTDEIIKHQQNPDLKGFLLGFSREVSKGESVEYAAGITLNPNYLINLNS